MIGTLIADELRFLTFRRTSPAVHTHGTWYLAFGLFATWLAGVGRYWDNPRAFHWQQLGLGSVVYVFLLALLIWALMAPLRPKNWSYKNVLVFVTLTAPPALIYAIPVEEFMPMGSAQVVNAWFLGVVSVWRVALLAVFLRRVAGLSLWIVAVATLLPLVVIIVPIALLNPEHVVLLFAVMGGVREDTTGPNDVAYTIVLILSIVSILAAPVLLTFYFVAIVFARRDAKETAAADPPPVPRV